MNLPQAKPSNESRQQKLAVQELRRRHGNAKKAKERANELFPGETWEKIEDGIYLSTRRKIGKDTNYEEEKKDAQILSSFGNTVYLVPENSRSKGKKYDAIVNGQCMEFKNVEGNANTLETQFLRSRSQAPNVFINLENSSLTKRDVIDALVGARNKPPRKNKKESKGYVDSNYFSGGWIILNLKGHKNLIYLNVDSLRKR